MFNFLQLCTPRPRSMSSMNRNVEIKARVSDPENVRVLAASMANEGPVEISQDDTFFPCKSGRLKLRKFSSESGELIYYERADENGPKESFYVRSPTSTPDLLLETLSLAYGTLGRVQKHRTLYLVSRTRIHIDRVTGLGDFLELEVVLGDEEPSEAAFAEARDLMNKLGIVESQLVSGAYVDLLSGSST